jgi:transcriptional regulator with XRE-family HTH domain
MHQKRSSEAPHDARVTSVERRRAFEPASAPAPELLPAVATNVERLRSARALSLDELAARAQLSPLTLRRIELGLELPSLDTLWSLANGLGAEFSELLANPPADKPPLSRRSLLPSAGTGQTQLHQLTLAPHGEGLSAAGEPHTIESLLVTAGELIVYYGGESRVLSIGDEVAIPAHVERRYFNPTDQTVVVYAKLQPCEA